MSTAEYNRDNVFILNDYYVNYVVGVKPTDIAKKVKKQKKEEHI